MAKGRELELAIRIAGRLDGSLGRAVNSAQAQLDRIGRTANRIGTLATAAAIAAGAKIVKDSIQTYSEYETAVNSAAAVFNTPKGTEEYEELAEAARQVGLTTVKSAKEGANALEYMGLAGWSVADSTKALIPVVKLSAATGADLATTSDLVTDTMEAMRLKIEALPHFLDLMAIGNNNANYTSQQLLESMASVGGVFSSLNIGVEDGAAILGVLAQQHSKGAEAGTQLNTVLTRMQKQSGEAAKGMEKLGISMFDESGATRNIIDVFQDMYDATKNMTDEQKNQIFTLIGGTRGYRALTKIMNGFVSTTADGTTFIRSLAAAYRDADGALDNFYDIKTDTLEASGIRIKRLYEEMLLSIGEGLAPHISELADHLEANMPQISDTITSIINDVAPSVINFIDYLIGHLPEVIKNIAAFAKGFVKFKIATSVIRGLSDFTMLLTNLQKIAAGKGIAKVISGIVKAFTGINTSALASAFPAIGGAISGMLSAAAPLVGVAAALAAVGAAIEIIDKHFNYTRGMEQYAEGIANAAQELIKYNDIAAEIQNLKLVINSPQSNQEQLDAAKQRLQEIAEMLGLDWSFEINCDTTQLETAVDTMQSINRKELIENASSQYETALKGMDDQLGYLDAIKRNQATADFYSKIEPTITNMRASADLLKSQYEANSDLMSEADYYAGLQRIRDEGIRMGLEFKNSVGDITDSFQAGLFLNDIYGFEDDLKINGEYAQRTVSDAQQKVDTYRNSLNESAESLAKVLASDIRAGNMDNAKFDISYLQEYGEIMQKTEMNTDALAMQFAEAMMGANDFSTALGKNGENAQAMADNYMKFKDVIGDTTENAVSGAALIANGFENAQAATAAGADAINNILNDMRSFGSAQGLFDGLDASGIADKITDMAHALNLIPANKAIRINADGNFEIIQEAENQIASLKSVGNVNVHLNADGNLTVLNAAGAQINALRLQGAVNLQVNADGNIDVLNEAQQVIATIDRITGKTVYVDATVKAGKINAGPVREEIKSAVDMFMSGGTATASSSVNVNVDANTNPAATKISGLNQHLVTVPVTANVRAAEEKINGLSRTVEVTVHYTATGDVPKQSASGARYFSGGLTYLNDQRVSDPREVVEYGGKRWWYEGRDVLANLPKGARIYTASQSREFIDGSHRNGLDRVPFDGYIAELHRGERVLTAAEANGYEGFTIGDMVDMLGDMIEEMRGGTGSGETNTGGGERQIVFAPNITVTGGGDEQTIRQAVRLSYKEFKEMMKEYDREQSRKVF